MYLRLSTRAPKHPPVWQKMTHKQLMLCCLCSRMHSRPKTPPLGFDCGTRAPKHLPVDLLALQNFVPAPQNTPSDLYSRSKTPPCFATRAPKHPLRRKPKTQGRIKPLKRQKRSQARLHYRVKKRPERTLWECTRAPKHPPLTEENTARSSWFLSRGSF
jgi:hypothetical protein